MKKFSVVACTPDYVSSLIIFESDNFEQCISLANACYQGSSSCFKVILSDSSETLVSFIKH